MKAMNSHELAKVLLGLPDKPVEVVKGEGQYTSEWEFVGVPWDFWGGTIRFQIQPKKYENAANSASAEEKSE